MESELSGIFQVSSKTSHQKYSAWVPGDPIYANEGQRNIVNDHKTQGESKIYLTIQINLYEYKK